MKINAQKFEDDNTQWQIELIVETVLLTSRSTKKMPIWFFATSVAPISVAVFPSGQTAYEVDHVF